MEDLFARLGQRRDRPRRPLPGVGLHGRQRRADRRAAAALRDDGVRGARRHEPRRPPRPGGRAGVRARAPARPPTTRTGSCASCGTFTVPCYLDPPGCPPGSRFAFADAKGNDPVRLPGNTMLANFVCIVRAATPRNRRARRSTATACSATPPRSTCRPARDGQRAQLRLLRDRLEGDGDRGRAERGHDPERPVALPDADRPAAAGDPQLPLPRAADDPPETASTPTRRFGGKHRHARLFYDGNSQGGIYGGTLTAVAPDLTRAVLGVPAMNYSTLLHRSADFAEYATVLYAAYPNELERPLLFSLIQLLWDRTDPNGYAHHMTTTRTRHAARTGAAAAALGDHQVANVAADVEARTIGARIRANPVATGRSNDANPFYAIPTTGFPAARRSTSRGTRARPSTRSPRTRTSRPSAQPRTRTRTACRVARRPPSTRSPGTCGSAARSPTVAGADLRGASVASSSQNSSSARAMLCRASARGAAPELGRSRGARARGPRIPRVLALRPACSTASAAHPRRRELSEEQL